MTKPCLHCSHPTTRYDGQCYNCYYASPDSDNPQSPMEALTIPHENYVCACGESRTPVLNLMCKGNAFLMRGPARTDRPNARDKRAFLVEQDPNLWYAKCWNCLKADKKPGRPRKYTDEERKWNRLNYSKVYRGNVLSRLLQSYGSKGAWPECTACLQPATRVLYIGEFGKAPLGNHAFRCRLMALKDEYWHNQFAPYCDSHEVMSLTERKRYKRRLWAEHLAETTYKANRSFAELQRLGEV